MATTPNTNIPLIEQGEINGHVTYGTGSQINDLHNQSIVEALQTAEPGSPAEGQAWIINGTPTGSNWGSDASANQVAHFYGGIWHYYTPLEGWRFYNKGDTLIWQYNGVSWQIYIAGDIPPNQTWQALQDYDTPLTTPSLSSGSYHDIIIPGSFQIGSELSYNGTTGELTYSGQNAVFECSFTIIISGGGIGNNQNYSARIYDSVNTENVVIGAVYVTSNSVSAITISGSLLYTINNGDILKLQFQPSNTLTVDIAGGWFVHKMYNL